MDFTKLRVLVMDGGGKQTLAMVRGLKDIGCHVTVLCNSKMDTCYVSKKPDEKIVNPILPERNEEALKFLLDLVATGKYDVLMPIGELSTNFITDHEEEFKKYVKLACAPRDTYIKAFNKQTTFDQAMKSGIPCPYTRQSNQDIEDFLQHCRFPIIIKPRQGLGSIGFHKFETEQEFRERLENDPSFNPDDYVVQEFVKFNNRIGTNLFVDQKGNICSSYAVDVLRWFPIDAGAGVLIVTVDAHEVLQYAGKLLQDLGWQGFANVAFMVDAETGEPRLLEINGRIPASVKMAYMCGCNISRQLLEMIYDEDVIQYPENNKFGMYIRHLDTDLVWFFKSPNRFRTKPSWFSWKNTQEILYSKDDKKPFFFHLFQKFFNFSKIMKRKAH
ncbi:MAG: ATP-grasp domain-containing protein [Clostridia bacterium]|nr:ATP-grasp domain-containing protein [Clostridia bacterium]